MLKLNLGCGNKLWKNFVNIDLPGSGADLECDIRQLPYEDATVDEIHAIHVFEHFYLHEVPGILAEWYRVLVPEGQLVLEMPCFDKLIAYIQGNNPAFFDPRLVQWPLYGDPSTIKTEHDLHKWCWSIAELKKALLTAKFKNPVFSMPQHHIAHRDMRVSVIK